MTTDIYTLYGQAEECHAQEREALIASFLEIILALKDGSLMLDDIKVTEQEIHIPAPTPGQPSPNGKEPTAVIK